jgi:dUTP pyrophosphatase
MQIKVKKLCDEAILPCKATSSDAGYDVVAIDDGIVDDLGFIQYKTGIAIEPDKGYHVEIFPRSSISKYDLVLANSIGLVDNGYRGEILVRFKPTLRFMQTPMSVNAYTVVPDVLRKYKKGDKIAQLVVRETIHADFEFVSDLETTDRGTGGFGSTGR